MGHSMKRPLSDLDGGDDQAYTEATRKRQAVATSVASSHQEDNDNTSLLLKLPPEIRTQIFRPVIGDNLIHILYTRRYRNSPAGFRHCICSAAKTEDEAYQQFIDGHCSAQPDDDPLYHVPTFKQRHARCKHWNRDMDQWFSEAERLQWWRTPQEDRLRHRLNVSILGVCRQLYGEASFLLWTTTTFSFEDPLTLSMFMNGRNSMQKDQLTVVHIDSEWEKEVSLAWAILMTPTFLKNFSGLQTLHATYNPIPDNWQKYGLTRLSTPARSPVLRMGVLPLQHVTVVVGDDVRGDMDVVFNNYRWTIDKKRAVADILRRKLLDHDGHMMVRDPEAKGPDVMMRELPGLYRIHWFK